MAEFKVKYKKSNDYRMVPVTGVWGGLTASGRITCEFFVEKVDHPELTQLIIDHENKSVKESEILRKTAEGMVREIQVGMSFDPNLAKTIANWLLKKVEEFEEIKVLVENETK